MSKREIKYFLYCGFIGRLWKQTVERRKVCQEFIGTRNRIQIMKVHMRHIVNTRRNEVLCGGRKLHIIVVIKRKVTHLSE